MFKRPLEGPPGELFLGFTFKKQNCLSGVLYSPSWTWGGTVWPSAPQSTSRHYQRALIWRSYKKPNYCSHYPRILGSMSVPRMQSPWMARMDYNGTPLIWQQPTYVYNKQNKMYPIWSIRVYSTLNCGSREVFWEPVSQNICLRMLCFEKPASHMNLVVKFFYKQFSATWW